MDIPMHTITSPNHTDVGAEPREGARSGRATRGAARGQQEEEDEEDADDEGRVPAKEEKPADGKHEGEEGARLSASRESSLSGHSSGGGAGAQGKRGRGRPSRKRSLPSEGAWRIGRAVGAGI